jgi:uncharacterized membrane protein
VSRTRPAAQPGRPAFRALVIWGEHAAAWVLAGSVLYLAGPVAVTISANVPLNDALAAVQPDSSGAASHWSRYLRRWTAWNHVRVTASPRSWTGGRPPGCS